MKRRASAWATPLVGLWVLGSIGFSTYAAVRRFDVWADRARDVALQMQADPYAALESALAPRVRPSELRLRDPFVIGTEPATNPLARRPPLRPKQPPTPAPPRLSAVIWSEQDRSAVIEWGGRSFTARAGQSFAGYRVISIAPDRVILDKEGVPIVLTVSKKGE